VLTECFQNFTENHLSYSFPETKKLGLSRTHTVLVYIKCCKVSFLSMTKYFTWKMSIMGTNCTHL